MFLRHEIKIRDGSTHMRYVKKGEKNNDILVPINPVRLRKRMYLPYKLIRIYSVSKMKEYREEIELSCKR